jgi:hypothetical protein
VVAMTRHQVGGCRQYLFLSPPGDHRRTRCLSHDLASSKETRPFDNFGQPIRRAEIGTMCGGK